MFDTLAALVDSSRSAVLRFSSEMRDWSRSTKSALEAQGTLIEGWIEVCAPQIGEARLVGGGHERLCVFLEQVLRPVIDGPWADLVSRVQFFILSPVTDDCALQDYEIRRSLLVKTEHLLSLFENPRSVIAKRNDKLLDHSRYLAKKLSVDRRGSEEFLVLSAQLSIELPRFLSSVSRYFNIIIAHFATAQATYHEAVQVAWTAYADQWFVQIPAGPYAVIESSFASSHLPVAEMMDTLAAGLGVTPTRTSLSTLLQAACSANASSRSQLSSHPRATFARPRFPNPPPRPPSQTDPSLDNAYPWPLVSATSPPTEALSRAGRTAAASRRNPRHRPSPCPTPPADRPTELRRPLLFLRRESRTARKGSSRRNDALAARRRRYSYHRTTTSLLFLSPASPPPNGEPSPLPSLPLSRAESRRPRSKPRRRRRTRSTKSLRKGHGGLRVGARERSASRYTTRRRTCRLSKRSRSSTRRRRWLRRGRTRSGVGTRSCRLSESSSAVSMYGN